MEFLGGKILHDKKRNIKKKTTPLPMLCLDNIMPAGVSAALSPPLGSFCPVIKGGRARSWTNLGS